MAVNYDYYRIFCAVAKQENITAAAKTLYLSQPTVSKYIQGLEQALGCSLFIRSKTGVCLTPEARRLYQRIAPAVEQIRLAEEELEDARTLRDGAVRIGASEMTLQHYLPPVLRRFRSEHPGIRLRIRNRSTPDALEALQTGLVDVAVVTSPVGNPMRETLCVQPLAAFQDLLVAGRAFPRPSAPLSYQEVAACPLVCMAEGTASRQFLEDIFRERGFSLEPDMEVETLDLLMPMIRQGFGIGFVPEAFARKDLQNGETYCLPLEEAPPSRKIVMVTDGSRPLSMAAQAFIETLMFEEKRGAEPDKNCQKGIV